MNTIGFHSGDQNSEYLNFQVLDPGTGKVIWQLTDKPFGKALIAGDNVILTYADTLQIQPTTSTTLIPTPGGPFQLVARDLASGREVWHTVTDFASDYYVVGNTLYQCNNDSWRWWDVNGGKLLGQQDIGGNYSCPNNSIGNDVWLSEFRRTSSDNTNFENPIEDSWYEAIQISTGNDIWSTAVLLHHEVAIAAVGDFVVLTFQDTKNA